MKTKAIKFFQKLFKTIIYASGLVALCLLILAFTDIPYYAYHALSLPGQHLEEKADAIVIMGGEGMPSPSDLMRLYYGAQSAQENKDAKVILALPKNEKNQFEQLKLMRNELNLKGISNDRISYASNGFNTRTQALEIEKLISKEDKLIIVSSPEHLYRAVKCFEKVGFKSVGSLAAFERPSDAERLKDKDAKEEDKVGNLTLRYNVWSYLQYEIKVLREYAAISYYKLKGWI